MKREIYAQLLEWKNSARRKPLVLYGARQVGKTYILKEFGRNEYDNLVYVNCFKNPEIETLFDGDANAERILLGLAAYSNQKILPGKTLVFLDEAQEIPRTISMLKYFCEDKPEIHIVVAGSLLGVMNMKNESYPVGKVNILHLYPMNFMEFIMALGQDELASLLMSGDYKMIVAFNNRLVEFLRQYYYVGGMPEAVKYFVENKDPIGVRQIQTEILSAYETDISKHSGSETQRIRLVWNSVPAQLARENKKFIYGAVKKSGRAKDFEIAIQWLVDAGLVYRIEKVSDAKLPLKFYAVNSAFKLYVLDVGLLGAMSETPAGQMLIGQNVFFEYKGAFTENYVLQQMKAIKGLSIYYYSKDDSTQEIDFLVQQGGRIIPIEVKAEENVKSKSLRTFVCVDQKNNAFKGLRFSMKDYADQEWMENVPLYMVDSYFKQCDASNYCK